MKRQESSITAPVASQLTTPYCDGSHETGNTGKTPAKVEIAGAKQVAICDCGKTGTSPFCDGSHSKITVAALS
jgi:CDGSH-type Zn-finger protein